jgi:hypothetical protein
MASILVYPGKGMMNDVEYYYHRSRVVKMGMNKSLAGPFSERHHSAYKCPVVNVEPCRFTVYIRNILKRVNSSKLKSTFLKNHLHTFYFAGHWEWGVHRERVSQP